MLIYLDVSTLLAHFGWCAEMLKNDIIGFCLADWRYEIWNILNLFVQMSL